MLEIQTRLSRIPRLVPINFHCGKKSTRPAGRAAHERKKPTVQKSRQDIFNLDVSQSVISTQEISIDGVSPTDSITLWSHLKTRPLRAFPLFPL